MGDTYSGHRAEPARDDQDLHRRSCGADGRGRCAWGTTLRFMGLCGVPESDKVARQNARDALPGRPGAMKGLQIFRADCAVDPGSILRFVWRGRGVVARRTALFVGAWDRLSRADNL